MNTKSSIFMLLVIFQISIYAQENTSGLLERNQIEEKYKWDTRDIYENEQEWEKDFKWIEVNLFQYNKHIGKLGSSSENLLECLQLDESIKKKLGYVWLYAKLHRDVEMHNETISANVVKVFYA